MLQWIMEFRARIVNCVAFTRRAHLLFSLSILIFGDIGGDDNPPLPTGDEPPLPTGDEPLEPRCVRCGEPAPL
jgi:hypothetical protein